MLCNGDLFRSSFPSKGLASGIRKLSLVGLVFESTNFIFSWGSSEIGDSVTSVSDMQAPFLRLHCQGFSPLLLLMRGLKHLLVESFSLSEFLCVGLYDYPSFTGFKREQLLPI